MTINIPIHSILLSVNTFQDSTPKEIVYPIINFWTVFFPLIIGLIVWLYLSRPLVFITGTGGFIRKKDEFDNYTSEYQLKIKLINTGNRTAKIKDILIQGYQDANPDNPLSYKRPYDGGLIYFNPEAKFSNPLPKNESLDFNVNLSFFSNIANYVFIKIRYFDYDIKFLHFSQKYYFKVKDNLLQDALIDGEKRLKQLIKREKKISKSPRNEESD